MNKFRCSNNGVGLALDCTAASAYGIVPGAGPSIMCANSTGSKVCIVWSDSLPLVATRSGYPIVAHSKEAVDVPSTALYVAAIVVDGDLTEGRPLDVLMHFHRGYETEE